MRIILYSKPGCHLCEGLQEKLEQIQPPIDLEIRDITSRDDWFQAYQYEIPVLFLERTTTNPSELVPLPRPSPRASVAQLQQLLQRWLLESEQNKPK
jgi:glutaredoxin